jgi:hypothetical protein
MLTTMCFQFRASPAVLSMWPCQNISHIQVLVTYFFPTPPIELKLGLQIGGKLLIGYVDYLANQKQGAVNKHDLSVFIRLFQGSSRPLKAVHFSRVTAVKQQSCSESTGFGCCTSLKISSAGPHSQCWRRCSYGCHLTPKCQRKAKYIEKQTKLVHPDD